MAGITIRGLSKRFGAGDDAFAAVSDLDLVIANNQFVTLLGPSGCGKTTTLRLIAGYVTPDAGTIHVEDRLVGIKSREIYEAPGAVALLTAREELSNVTLERDLARFYRSTSQRWSELVYDGLWYSPLKRALDSFLTASQQHVSGDIRMTLHAGAAVPTGRRSATSLYDFNLATYDEGDSFDQSLAKGFVDLWGLPSKIAAKRDQATGNVGA